MAQLRFLVAKCDIKGLPGLEKGAPVIKVAHEVVECQEYVVWHRIDDGTVAKTHIRHLDSFIPCEVDGLDMDECYAKALELSEGIKGGGNECEEH